MNYELNTQQNSEIRTENGPIVEKGGTRDTELADQLRGCNWHGGSSCGLPICPVCVAKLRLYIICEWVKSTGPFFSAPKLQFSSLQMAVPGERYLIGQLD